jgi:hypothetical protein
MFEDKNKLPICPMCKTKNYGFKHILRLTFNIESFKTVGLILLMQINLFIWGVGLAAILHIICK